MMLYKSAKQFFFAVSTMSFVLNAEAAGEWPKNPDSLIKSTQQELVKKLGEPAVKEKFAMKDAGPSEFRIELQNTYPLNKPKNLKIQIQEWTWNDGDKRLTIWLHQVKGKWVALNVFQWKTGMEF